MNEAYLKEFEELTEEYLELNKQSLTPIEVDNIFSAYDELAAWYDRQQTFDQHYG